VRAHDRPLEAGESMSEPCPCQACVVAGVDRPSVTIPAWQHIPARELHGVELRDYLAAQDRLRATIAKLRNFVPRRGEP
jgi:hypothetical protein